MSLFTTHDALTEIGGVRAPAEAALDRPRKVTEDLPMAPKAPKGHSQKGPEI
jgi:hypothetical protein